MLEVAGWDDPSIYGSLLWRNFAGGRTLENENLQPRTRLYGCSTRRTLSVLCKCRIVVRFHPLCPKTFCFWRFFRPCFGTLQWLDAFSTGTRWLAQDYFQYVAKTWPCEGSCWVPAHCEHSPFVQNVFLYDPRWCGACLGSCPAWRTTRISIQTPHWRTFGDSKFSNWQILEREHADLDYQFGFVKSFWPCALAVTLASLIQPRHLWLCFLDFTKFV